MNPPKKKTKIGKIRKQAQAMIEGIAKAEENAEKKKDLEVSLREHLGRMIDRIDPIETLAVVGATIMIHNTIIVSETLLHRVAGMKGLFPANLFKEFPSAIGLGSAALAGILAAQTTEELLQKFGMTNDPEVWLVSFAIAFLLIRYGGQIISGLGQGANLLAVIGAFLI